MTAFHSFSHSLTSLIGNCLNLPFETQRRPRRLNLFSTNQKWGTCKGFCVWVGPRESCLFSQPQVIPPKQGLFTLFKWDWKPKCPPASLEASLQTLVTFVQRTGVGTTQKHSFGTKGKHAYLNLLFFLSFPFFFLEISFQNVGFFSYNNANNPLQATCFLGTEAQEASSKS